MYKQIGKMVIAMSSIIMLIACSSAKSELTDVQDDVMKHVKDPVVQIQDDMKEYERVLLDNPDIAHEDYEEYKEEYTSYLENDMVEVIDTSKQYLFDYTQLRTEEGQLVFDAYQRTYDAYFDLLEKNGQFLVDLLADKLSDEDFDEFAKELEVIDLKINDELDELHKLFSTYEDEYDIEFVDPLY